MTSEHLKEMLVNKECWSRKKTLRMIYHQFYKQIEQATVGDRIIEIGSGIGVGKEFIPNLEITDIYNNPWLDSVESAYKLSYKDKSIDTLILFDVWHHLEYPFAALNEFRRVLKPKGRVIIFDPDMSILGRIIYGLLHHEPLGFTHKFQTQITKPITYFAAQSSAYRFFVKKQSPEALNKWNKIETNRIVSFAYIGTGGFKGPSLYPSWLFSAINAFDRSLQMFSNLFSVRLLLVLEKH
jgi:SAM-dependent methyltransferase